MEHLQDLGAAVLLADLGGRQAQELGEVDATGLIFVELGQDLVHELVLAGEAQVDEGLLQLGGVHDAAAVRVEDLEGLADVDDLLAGQGQRHEVVGIEGLAGGGGLAALRLGRGRDRLGRGISIA